MSIITTAWAGLNGVVLTGMVWFGVTHYEQAYAVEQVHIMSEDEKHCLRENIYWESRSESNLGQMAVAYVTLNRVRDAAYPDTICKVVKQRSQFSWTNEDLELDLSNDIEKKAWANAYYNAYAALLVYEMEMDDFTDGALMFHADYVEPYWAEAYTKTVKIDTHIFYTR